MDPTPAQIEWRCVPDDDCRRRLRERSRLIRVAAPHMEWVSSLMGDVPHAVYITDQDGIVLSARGDADIIEKFRLTPGHDWSERQMGTNGAGTALATGQPVAVIGPEHYSDTFHDCTCTGAPIHAPNGKLIGAIDLSTSVADGRPELLAMVAHVAFVIERELAHQATEAQSRRKSEFLAMLAHELRNPLMPIHNAIDLLGLVGNDPARREGLRQLLQRQVTQVVRLVDDLMDIARVSRGKVRLEMERIDLQQVVTTAVEAARAGADGIDLRVEEAQAPLAVMGDPGRLAQVFANLLTNACKFTPVGRRVWLSVTQEADKAVVRVRDEGIGIEPDRLEEIFDLFTQLPGPQDEPTAGLGVGLALVQRLVEMHGGSVTAFSEGKGKGAEFRVELPLAEGPATPAEEVDAPGETAPLRILLVEDSRVVADVFVMLLQELGHRVELAETGPAALEIARRAKPDVIVSDISMPGMSGYELVKRLREEEALRGVYLVAMTAHSQPEDRERALQAGFDQHVTKPIDLDRLRSLLAEAAERRRSPLD